MRSTRNHSMRALSVLPAAALVFLFAGQGRAEDEGSPLARLPSHITRLTHFGQRADWSHDGKRILFLEKTFGDVYEVEVATRTIRPKTHHYFHEGYTRALYLSNGDILLSGARRFDAENPWPSRRDNAELWVLQKGRPGPPVALGEKCSEGPAVSRRAMRIAWTVDHGDAPDRLPRGVSQIWVADVVTAGGRPGLRSKRLVVDSRRLPFEAGLETQNFRPPEEKELIFSAYGYQGTEVMGVDIESGEVINYSKAPAQYDEPEGIFPDGRFTLVECDFHSRKGSQHIDIYKLSLDGSGDTQRLTFFNSFPGYKASNPVVSDDGRFMAFQVARVGDAAGVGRGILVFDLERGARRLQRWDSAYRDGRRPPWDTGRPSTELKKVIESGVIRPCRAVVLGCGTGTNAVYLAGQGFDVTGIDIAPTALRRAGEKAQEAGVEIRWVHADVLALPPLEPFDFIFDRGCYHGVRRQSAAAYLDTLRRLSRPGTRVLILAGNASEPPPHSGPPRVTETELRVELASPETSPFEIERLETTHFDATDASEKGALAWSLLLRRTKGS